MYIDVTNEEHRNSRSSPAVLARIQDEEGAHLNPLSAGSWSRCGGGGGAAGGGHTNAG